MKYRTFGKMNRSISEIGYGMWGMAGWTGSDDEESFRSLSPELMKEPEKHRWNRTPQQWSQ